MLLELNGPPANPSSVHFFGQQARALLTQARSTVAQFFQCKPSEIVFTSGATEGLNYLLHDLGPSDHVITTHLEHSSVYNALSSVAVSYIPVDLKGAPRVEDIAQAILPHTKAIVLSSANSETGVKIDLEALSTLALRHRIPLLIDAVATIGKDPFILYPGMAAVAFSAHKFHGPKGVGAVYLRPDFKPSPLILGGGQENGRRAGTPSLSGILGLAEALQILLEEQFAVSRMLTDLRDHFERELTARIPQIVINGEGPRVSNTSNIAFLGLDGETLLMQLDLLKIAVSHGSACSSGALEPSRILLNMGIDRKRARSSLRFSFSRMNTREEIDEAIERIVPLVSRLRK